MSTSVPNGFTSDELLTSVENIVLSSINRPYDTLGVRRTDITFTDVQEAAAGVFLLYRDAPFYVLLLSCQRTLELLADEADLIAQILSAISAIGRTVLPVNDLSNLANARAALLDLESSIAQRQQAFSDLSTVPAFVRYQNNVSQFLSGPGQNVKDQGQIVMTPQEARGTLPSLISALHDSHSNLISSTKLLRDGMQNFSSLNLPALVAEGVVSRSRSVLDAHLTALQAQSPEERLSALRSVVLDMLTQLGVIKQFASFSGPVDTFPLSGTGTPFSDAAHLATPASLPATTSGPYALRKGRNTLDFFLDEAVSAKYSATITSITQGTNAQEALFTQAPAYVGIVPGDVIYPLTGANAGSRWVVKSVLGNQLLCTGDANPVVPDASPSITIYPAPSASVVLANALLASIDGYLPEPFDTTGTHGRDLFFTIDTTQVICLLPLSSTNSATAICNSINTAIGIEAPGKAVVAEPYFSPLRYDSLVAISGLGGNSYRFTVLAGSLDGLGIVTGDLVELITGPDALSSAAITAIGPSPIQYVDATFAGPLTSSGTRQEIQIGPANRKVRIRCSNDSSCLSTGLRLSVDTVSTNGAATVLGMVPGFFSTSKKVQVRDLVKDFNQRTLSVVASTSQVTTFQGNFKTSPFFPTTVVAYKASGTGDVAAAGMSITVTPAFDPIAAGVIVGDVLVLRNGPNPNTVWAIDAVTSTSIHATGSTSASSQTGLSMDIGIDLSAVPNLVGMAVTIDSGPNKGDYEVSTLGSVPLEIALTQNLPLQKDSQAQPIEMTGTLGAATVVFSSTTQTTASRIQAYGSAGALFFPGGLSPLAVGSSSWFLLPKVPQGLQENDQLQVFLSQYNNPTTIYTIESVEPENLLIEISPEMPSNQSWVFSDSIPPPFAKIQAKDFDDAGALSVATATWLTQSVNQDSYFVDLARFLNPILVNANPTASQINDAKNRVLDLLQLLTITGAQGRSADPTITLESILSSYDANHVPALDNLITTFTQKGADRAIDTLLSSDFVGFFGAGADTSSYAGAMLSAIRDVALNDMPVSKVNRADAVQGKQLASGSSDDFEFSSGDTETASPPDVPVTG